MHLEGIISCNSNDQVTDNYDINNERKYDELIAGTIRVRRALDHKRALKLHRHYNEKKKNRGWIRSVSKIPIDLGCHHP